MIFLTSLFPKASSSAVSSPVAYSYMTGCPKEPWELGGEKGVPSCCSRHKSRKCAVAHGQVMNSWSKGYVGRGGNALIITFKLLTFHTLTVFGQLKKTDIGAFNLTISVLTVTSTPWLLHLLSLAITFFNKNTTIKTHAQYQNDYSYGALYVQPSENSKTISKIKAYYAKIKNYRAVKRIWNSPDSHY